MPPPVPGREGTRSPASSLDSSGAPRPEEPTTSRRGPPKPGRWSRLRPSHLPSRLPSLPGHPCPARLPRKLRKVRDLLPRSLLRAPPLKGLRWGPASRRGRIPATLPAPRIGDRPVRASSPDSSAGRRPRPRTRVPDPEGPETSGPDSTPRRSRVAAGPGPVRRPPGRVEEGGAGRRDRSAEAPTTWTDSTARSRRRAPLLRWSLPLRARPARRGPPLRNDPLRLEDPARSPRW